MARGSTSLSKQWLSLDDLVALFGSKPDYAIIDARFRRAVLEGLLVDERGTPPEMWRQCFDRMDHIGWDFVPMVAMPDPDLAGQEEDRRFYMPRFRTAVWFQLFRDLIPDAFSNASSSPTPKSRKQRLIQQIAAEEFPGGYDQIPTNEIIHRVSDRLRRQSLPVPGRDTFNRALGRRAD
jgi:hypothetical protein